MSWSGPLTIALLSFTAFIPALHGEFVSWDDAANFVSNPHYRGLGWTQLKWMWTTFHLGHYMPLTWMTHGADYALWGMNPVGYHVVNLLLHAANAVLVYFIALRFFRLARAGSEADEAAVAIPAAFAALFYAVHPLRVESVAWITERRDVLSMLFFLSSIVFYLRATERRVDFKRRYALAIATFICALLSKATSVTLPALLFVLNVYPLRRLGGDAGWVTPGARRVYLELVPFGLLSAGTAALSLLALQEITPLSVPGKVAVSAYSFVFYLWKTLVPLNLAPLYEMKPVDPAAPMFVASAAVVLILAAALWSVRHRWPALIAAFVAFFVVVFPLLGIVQNGPQIAADRYTYHAAPALALLAGALLLPDSHRRTRLGFATVIVLLFGALTWNQSRVWRNSKALWSQVLRVDSASSIANNDFGVELAREGRRAGAVEHYRRALALRPAYADPHNNWGFELDAAGRSLEAIDHYSRALEIKPDYAEAEINLGNALVNLGRLDEAIQHYRNVARARPEHAGAQLNWGVALAKQGHFAEAAERFSRALEIDASLDDARIYLDRATFELRRQQQTQRRAPQR